MTFSRDARFVATTFTGDAGFGRTTFDDLAWFDHATFTSTAWFGEATFTSKAWFDWVTFAGVAWFGGATFSDEALFGETTFSGDADFGEATFTPVPRALGARIRTDPAKPEPTSSSWPLGWTVEMRESQPGQEEQGWAQLVPVPVVLAGTGLVTRTRVAGPNASR